MGPQEDYVETVVTCVGDYYDPEFPNQLRKFRHRLQKLLVSDTQKLIVKKVEPWNSVRVTFNIPKEAAQRLSALAQQGDRALRELGILAVQVEGDQIISLTIAGRNNEKTELVFRTTEKSSAAASQPCASTSFSSADEAGVPGPSHSEATRKNIAHYLSQQGGTSVFDSLFRGSEPEMFKSPNVVAPHSEALPQRQPCPSTSRAPQMNSPGMVAPFNFPPVHAGFSSKMPAAGVGPNGPQPVGPGVPMMQGPHNVSPQRHPGQHNRGLTSSSPLLVNLLQTDMTAGHMNNLPPSRMSELFFGEAQVQTPKNKRRRPRKPKDGSSPGSTSPGQAETSRANKEPTLDPLQQRLRDERMMEAIEAVASGNTRDMLREAEEFADEGLLMETETVSSHANDDTSQNSLVSDQPYSAVLPWPSIGEGDNKEDIRTSSEVPKSLGGDTPVAAMSAIPTPVAALNIKNTEESDCAQPMQQNSSPNNDAGTEPKNPSASSAVTTETSQLGHITIKIGEKRKTDALSSAASEAGCSNSGVTGVLGGHDLNNIGPVTPPADVEPSQGVMELPSNLPQSECVDRKHESSSFNHSDRAEQMSPALVSNDITCENHIGGDDNADNSNSSRNTAEHGNKSVSDSLEPFSHTRIGDLQNCTLNSSVGMSPQSAGTASSESPQSTPMLSNNDQDINIVTVGCVMDGSVPKFSKSVDPEFCVNAVDEFQHSLKSGLAKSELVGDITSDLELIKSEMGVLKGGSLSETNSSEKTDSSNLINVKVSLDEAGDASVISPVNSKEAPASPSKDSLETSSSDANKDVPQESPHMSVPAEPMETETNESPDKQIVEGNVQEKELQPVCDNPAVMEKVHDSPVGGVAKTETDNSERSLPLQSNATHGLDPSSATVVENSVVDPEVENSSQESSSLGSSFDVVEPVMPVPSLPQPETMDTGTDTTDSGLMETTDSSPTDDHPGCTKSGASASVIEQSEKTLSSTEDTSPNRTTHVEMDSHLKPNAAETNTTLPHEVPSTSQSCTSVPERGSTLPTNAQEDTNITNTGPVAGASVTPVQEDAPISLPEPDTMDSTAPVPEPIVAVAPLAVSEMVATDPTSSSLPMSDQAQETAGGTVNSQVGSNNGGDSNGDGDEMTPPVVHHTPVANQLADNGEVDKALESSFIAPTYVEPSDTSASDELEPSDTQSMTTPLMIITEHPSSGDDTQSSCSAGDILLISPVKTSASGGGGGLDLISEQYDMDSDASSKNNSGTQSPVTGVPESGLEAEPVVASAITAETSVDRTPTEVDETGDDQTVVSVAEPEIAKSEPGCGQDFEKTDHEVGNSDSIPMVAQEDCPAAVSGAANVTPVEASSFCDGQVTTSGAEHAESTELVSIEDAAKSSTETRSNLAESSQLPESSEIDDLPLDLSASETSPSRKRHKSGSKGISILKPLIDRNAALEKEVDSGNDNKTADSLPIVIKVGQNCTPAVSGVVTCTSAPQPTTSSSSFTIDSILDSKPSHNTTKESSSTIPHIQASIPTANPPPAKEESKGDRLLLHRSQPLVSAFSSGNAVATHLFNESLDSHPKMSTPYNHKSHSSIHLSFLQKSLQTPPSVLTTIATPQFANKLTDSVRSVMKTEEPFIQIVKPIATHAVQGLKTGIVPPMVVNDIHPQITPTLVSSKETLSLMLSPPLKLSTSGNLSPPLRSKTSAFSVPASSVSDHEHKAYAPRSVLHSTELSSLELLASAARAHATQNQIVEHMSPPGVKSADLQVVALTAPDTQVNVAESDVANQAKPEPTASESVNAIEETMASPNIESSTTADGDANGNGTSDCEASSSSETREKVIPQKRKFDETPNALDVNLSPEDSAEIPNKKLKPSPENDEQSETNSTEVNHNDIAGAHEVTKNEKMNDVSVNESVACDKADEQQSETDGSRRRHDSGESTSTCKSDRDDESGRVTRHSNRHSESGTSPRNGRSLRSVTRQSESETSGTPARSSRSTRSRNAEVSPDVKSHDEKSNDSVASDLNNVEGKVLRGGRNAKRKLGCEDANCDASDKKSKQGEDIENEAGAKTRSTRGAKANVKNNAKEMVVERVGTRRGAKKEEQLPTPPPGNATANKKATEVAGAKTPGERRATRSKGQSDLQALPNTYRNRPNKAKR